MSERIYMLNRAGKRDSDGHAIQRNWNARRLTERSTDEFIGICRGLIMDNAVSEEEAGFLKRWLSTSRNAASSWPGNVIAPDSIRSLKTGSLIQKNGKIYSIFYGKWSAHRKKFYPLTGPLPVPSPNQRHPSFLPINSSA